jgi:hypothetical protein
MELINSIVNNVVYLSLFFLLISVVVGLYLRGRSKDRCLLSFEDSEVTAESEGKQVWGRLRVFSTGAELCYAETREDDDGHVENSYIVYANEFASLDLLMRFHDKPEPAGQKKRRRDIKRTYRPSLMRRTRRRMRNFFTTFRDSVLQTLQSVMGAASKTSTAGKVFARQKEIAGMSKQLLGGETAYDPILEHYIGRFVVVDGTRSGESVEYHGILREYTSVFLELMNVSVPDAPGAEGKRRVADLVLPRSRALVRHAGVSDDGADALLEEALGDTAAE